MFYSTHTDRNYHLQILYFPQTEPEDHTWVTAYYFSPQLVRDALQRPDDLPYLYPKPNKVGSSQKVNAEFAQIALLTNSAGYKHWLREQLTHIDATDREWVASYYMNTSLIKMYEQTTLGEKITWNEACPYPVHADLVN
jgi:hypothetical protein